MLLTLSACPRGKKTRERAVVLKHVKFKAYFDGGKSD
jgi:hypothetical protein